MLVEASTFAIQNVTLIPISSPIEEGATVLVDDGEIVAFGASIELPVDVELIECSLVQGGRKKSLNAAPTTSICPKYAKHDKVFTLA